MNLNDLLRGGLNQIRQTNGIPYKSGHLKYNGIYVDEFRHAIVYDSKIAPYVGYLQEGTGPHYIPNAFGRGITVYHPGSKKHKGFIDKNANEFADYLITHLKVERVVIK